MAKKITATLIEGDRYGLAVRRAGATKTIWFDKNTPVVVSPEERATLETKTISLTLTEADGNARPEVRPRFKFSETDVPDASPANAAVADGSRVFIPPAGKSQADGYGMPTRLDRVPNAELGSATNTIQSGGRIPTDSNSDDNIPKSDPIDGAAQRPETAGKGPETTVRTRQRPDGAGSAKLGPDGEVIHPGDEAAREASDAAENQQEQAGATKEQAGTQSRQPEQ